MRAKGKLMIKWIHTCLLFTLLMSVFYCYWVLTKAQNPVWVYLKCWIIAIPIIASYIQIHKCKRLGSYVLWAIGTIVFTCFLCYLTGIFLPFWFSIFIYIMRHVDRLNEAECNPDSSHFNLDERKRYQFMNEPTIKLLILFLLCYLLGIMSRNYQVCNLSLFGFIAYFFVSVGYSYLDNFEQYLNINGRVSNLPKKRMYGVTGAVLGGILLCTALFILPSVLTVSQRIYWNPSTKSVNQMDWSSQFPGQTKEENYGWDESILNYKDAKQMPKQIQWILQGIGMLITVSLIYGCIHIIRKTFENFRKAYAENGDIVENLKMESEKVEISEIKIRTKHKLNTKEQIRYEYRHAIRKYRKDQPKVSETPTEIEYAAGLLDDTNMKELHKRYEKARYGQE